MFYNKEIKFKEYADSFSIETSDMRGNPDCKIGHFGYNIWFRTPKGLTMDTYKNNNTMEKAILRVAKNNGLTFEGWITK